MRGFLKHFAPDEFRPDEISILEDALDDAWRRVEQSKAPWASEDHSLAGQSSLDTSSQWLRAANVMPNG